MSIQKSSNFQSVHKITVNDHQLTFEPSHKTILECTEAANVEIHYHCRDGYCGACRVTLEQGQVCYPNGEPLAYVGDNEVLPCCCIPTSNITITVD